MDSRATASHPALPPGMDQLLDPKPSGAIVPASVHNTEG